MEHCLEDHISYGLVGNHAVVLDLDADRYFRLGVQETHALAMLGGGSHSCELPLVEKLITRGFVRPGSGPPIVPVEQPRPLASALESDAAGGGISKREACRSSVGALLLLRVLGLSRMVKRARIIKAKHDRDDAPLAEDLDRAAYLARGFAEARIAVPMPRLCVPDSFALAQRLWARGLAADVYFGVQVEPLLAHAWVQRGSLVLSDPLNIAADYTAVFKL